MNTYSIEEKAATRKNLPGPLLDFLDSPRLTAAYMEIEKEVPLNLRQTEAVIEIIEVTLLGLESESALETNMRHALPELMEPLIQKLLAEINGRILKEARKSLDGKPPGGG